MVTTIIYKCRKFQMRKHSRAALLRITFCLHILHFLKSESTGLKRFFLEVSNLFSPTWYYHNAAEELTSYSTEDPPSYCPQLRLELCCWSCQPSRGPGWSPGDYYYNNLIVAIKLVALTILKVKLTIDPDNSPFPAFPSSRTSHKPSFLWRKNSFSLAWWSFGQDWFLILII